MFKFKNPKIQLSVVWIAWYLSTAALSYVAMTSEVGGNGKLVMAVAIGASILALFHACLRAHRSIQKKIATVESEVSRGGIL